MFAVIVSGGCGGHSSKLQNSDSTSNEQEQNQGVDPNGPDSYTNRIVEKLISEDTVYDLADFVKDTSKTIAKGDVLLYVPEDGEDISANTNYLTRINDALETGAIVAFADIQAEEIDNITRELGLKVPPYLPDNASDSEKAAIEDFYAFAARADGLDSEDVVIVNFYTFFGTDFISSDKEMTLTVYSGGQELTDFNPDDYEDDSANVVYEYIDERTAIFTLKIQPRLHATTQTTLFRISLTGAMNLKA
ncbi:MAG: hypothetical protein IJP48_07935 [Synergistaceae bacterium]|nr:hypothetical protein [Synergistaceae bacterium]